MGAPDHLWFDDEDEGGERAMNPEVQGLLEAGKCKEVCSSLEPPEGTQPRPHLDLSQ